MDDLLGVKPDAVFFSPGPGDPATADHPVALAREVMRRRVPLFGICFGSQILGRALGFGTYKLVYGHRGINQPVLDRATGKVEVTSHNHGFAVSVANRDIGLSAVDAPPEGRIDTEFGEVVPERQRRRRAAGLRRARIHRAVSPGGGGRPARRRLPFRQVPRSHRKGSHACLSGPTSTTCS
jgi:hypothetical protein